MHSSEENRRLWYHSEYKNLLAKDRTALKRWAEQCKHSVQIQSQRVAEHLRHSEDRLGHWANTAYYAYLEQTQAQSQFVSQVVQQAVSDADTARNNTNELKAEAVTAVVEHQANAVALTEAEAERRFTTVEAAAEQRIADAEARLRSQQLAYEAECRSRSYDAEQQHQEDLRQLAAAAAEADP